MNNRTTQHSRPRSHAACVTAIECGANIANTKSQRTMARSIQVASSEAFSGFFMRKSYLRMFGSRGPRKDSPKAGSEDYNARALMPDAPSSLALVDNYTRT